MTIVYHTPYSYSYRHRVAQCAPGIAVMSAKQFRARKCEGRVTGREGIECGTVRAFLLHDILE